jgi:amino acid adenylation domain-containing protein
MATNNLSERILKLPPEKRALFEARLDQKRRTPRLIIPKRKSAACYPLSYQQQGLWVLQQIDQNNVAYSVPCGLRLNGKLNSEILELTLNQLRLRHPGLRTTLSALEEHPVQKIAEPRDETLRMISVESLSEDQDQREAEAERLCREEAQIPFDLACGPLFRTLLIRLSGQDHILFINLHHVIADGWSLRILLEELSEFYSALIQQREPRIAELPNDYADYAVWQRNQLAEDLYGRQLSYWRKQLASVDTLDLPTDRPRPSIPSGRGANHQVRTSSATTARAREFIRCEGVTLFMLLSAAFKVLLARYSGQEDIAVGTPIANRPQEQLDGVIGCFVNTLVLRTDLSGDPTFLELLSRERHVTLEAYEHQDLPFEQLVHELHPQRDLSRSPLFQVMFGLQNDSGRSVEVGDLETHVMSLGNGMAKFDLTFSALETEATIQIDIDYSTDLFEAETIRRLGRHWEILLDEVLANPRRRLSSLTILDAAERQRLLAGWNDTVLKAAPELCLHQLFERQAAKTPELTSLCCNGQQLTYRGLNERANQLAHHLIALGVGPETVVGICLERSPEMIVGLLGILKSGGVYVPLDPNYPRQRLELLLELAQVRVLLTQNKFNNLFGNYTGISVCVDRAHGLAQQPAENPAVALATANLAYLIFTSGSTGTPKGVAITHSSVAILVDWAGEVFSAQELGGMLAGTSICFDMSVFEIFVPLCHGGRVILVENILHLADSPHAPEVRLISTVPSAMVELLAQLAVPTTIQTITLGGEALSSQLVDEIYGQTRVSRVLDCYGPTEDTQCSTYAVRRRSGPETIGRPITGTRAYILGHGQELLPIGALGELYLGGSGLARGYFNRSDVTAERFIPDPFGSIPGGRLYRTGDLARYLPDGSIEYRGRKDHQVKLRGFRIELGEIESALARHPAVAQQVVVVREDQPGVKRLVAYVVGKGASLTPQDLRAHLEGKLPDYLVPSIFVVLDALPLTPNGKLDRKALPMPEGRQSDQPFMPPQNELEKLIATVWQELLAVERVGIHDHFFELGGHSLLLVRAHARLQEQLKRKIPLVEFFQYPTIHRLAEHLSDNAAPLRQTARQRMTRRQPVGDAIAIVGMAGRFPGARNVGEFWNNVRDGVESISFFSEEELAAGGVDPQLLKNPNYVRAKGILSGIDQFDAAFFGYSPREAELIDPQQRIFLECAWEALEHAGLNPEDCGRTVGVYAGLTMSGYLLNVLSNPKLMAATDPFQVFLGNGNDHLPTRISYKLNLNGPSINVQTACSTSLVAIHMACQGLLHGECDLALAGGISAGAQEKSGYLYRPEGISSPDGHCRVFDAQAQGTVFSSGAGIVVLKCLSEAIADNDTIHAVIKASAINNDGSLKVGYTAPGVTGQAEVIAMTHAMAEVDVESIGYVEAHGTGTALGDPIEITALTQAFRASTPAKGFCAVGSVKSNIGHLDTAAGVAGLIKTVLALKHRQIPPSLHFQKPNPGIDFENSPFYVNTRLSEWRTNGSPRRAGVSSFGIGGTNAHVLLEEAPAPASHPETTGRPYELLLLSARTSSALDKVTADLLEHLKTTPENPLQDLTYTLQVGRKSFPHRRGLVCRDRAQAIQNLETGTGIINAHSDSKERGVVFMFTGQGSQYVNMGLELYQHEPLFRERLDLCIELLHEDTGLDLRQALYPAEPPATAASEPLNQTAIAQPALFAIEYALAGLWLSWGVKPRAMIGHSVGEYVAASLAGVFSWQDALKLVSFRGRLMQQMPAGAMLSVLLPTPATEALLKETGLAKSLSIAAVNAPGVCVVSGPIDAITRLEAELNIRKAASRRLRTSHAFHSAMMDEMIEPFVREVRRIKLQAPSLPYISNLSGRWITPAEATSPDYWGRHVRGTVRFSEGIEEIGKTADQILLEVGPGHTLMTLAKSHFKKQAGPLLLTSLPHPDETVPAQAFFVNTVGRLWASGAAIDWPGFHGGTKRRRVALPTYPFERKRYWIARQNQAHALATTGERKPLAEWFHLPSWKQTPLPGRSKWKRLLQQTKMTWLVFLDECGLTSRLTTELRRHSQGIVTVTAGPQFEKKSDAEFVLNPGFAADYQELFKHLRNSELLPDLVVHAGSLTSKNALSDDFHATAQETCFYSLLLLLQAIGEQAHDRKIRLKVISNHLHDVSGDEELSPAKALLLGPCRVASLEYPNIQCSSIDVVFPQPNAAKEQELVDLLLEELTHSASDEIVAYRNSRRWTQLFEPVRLESDATTSPFTEGRTYLITGGLGGIGLTLAQHIAQKARARLVLLSRTGLPSREQWPQRLASPEQNDRSIEQIRAVQALEQLGSEVLVLAADVSDREQMQRALEQVRSRFGAIHGVIHAAGLPGGGLIQLKTREQAEKVMAPKVAGTFLLGELLANAELDFFVLCSSLNAFGGVGQVDYCAANAVLDAYARKYSGRNIKSINWCAWQQVGMAVHTPVPPALRKQREKSLRLGIAPEEARDVLDRVLASSLPQVIVNTTGTPTQHHEGTPKDGNEAATDAETNSDSLHERPNLSSACVAPRSESEQIMAGIWQEQLGIENIGIDDNFSELGGHSLLAMQVIAGVREAFQVELPLKSLFETPTIRAFTEKVEAARQAGTNAAQATKPAVEPLPPLRKTEHTGEFPASYLQEYSFRRYEVEQRSPSYHLPICYELQGSINVPALIEGLRYLVDRHPILRTHFHARPDGLYQYVLASGELNCRIVDLSDLPVDHADAIVRQVCLEELKREFDLERDPVIRATLLQRGRDHVVLACIIHHIAADAQSLAIFGDELRQVCSSLAASQKPVLPPIEYSFADFADWHRTLLNGRWKQRYVNYWTEVLSKAPPLLELPHIKKNREGSYDGAAVSFDLEPELFQKVQSTAEAHGVTASHVLLTGFNCLLAKHTARQDILIGYASTLRTRKELAPVLGYFNNLLPFRNRIDPQQTFGEILEKTAQRVLDAVTHQELTLPELYQELFPHRDIFSDPLFRIVYNFVQTPNRGSGRNQGIRFKKLDVVSYNTRHDLVTNITQIGNLINIRFKYREALFDRQEVKKLAAEFVAILEKGTSQPHLSIHEILGGYPSSGSAGHL